MGSRKIAIPRATEREADITIAATARCVPPYAIGSEEVKQYLKEVFAIDASRAEAMMAVIDHTQVERRYIVSPVEHIIKARPLGEITREYQEHAVHLGRKVASDCLAKAGMTPREIDLLITVSCTGVMIPSLDAHLVNEMGFRADVKRLPITELGCAAGAAAMARASDYIRGYPESTALVIAVEIPSLTFQRDNLTQANLICTVLFGDGAAAAVVTGRDCGGRAGRPQPKIIDAASHLFADTLDAMGFDLKESGFHIVLSKDVPQLIREHIRQLLCAFLSRHNLRTEEIAAFVLHPGGQKLLQYLEEELGLKRVDTQPSWDVLRDYGNLSSASVLFVLDEWLTKRDVGAGEYGVMAAFGPGFSAELLLLEWG